MAPGSNVALTISGGPDEFWDWTGGVGPADAANQANWSLGGVDLSVPANPYAPPIDSGERAAVRTNTTWNTGALTCNNLIINSNATLNISGATLTPSAAIQLGTGAQLSIGAPAGALILNSGSLTTVANVNIGGTSVASGGNGVFEIRGGTFTMTTTAGNISVGAIDAGNGAGVGLFHFNGSAGIVNIHRALNLSGPTSALKWTGDAGGFCTVNMPETNRDLNLNYGSIIVDAANVAHGAALQTWKLLDCGANIVDTNNILTTAVTIIPAVGTAQAQWKLEGVDTNANSIPDELVLTYDPSIASVEDWRRM